VCVFVVGAHVYMHVCVLKFTVCLCACVYVSVLFVRVYVCVHFTSDFHTLDSIVPQNYLHCTIVCCLCVHVCMHTLHLTLTHPTAQIPRATYFIARMSVFVTVSV
jgi:hypothetical protein